MKTSELTGAALDWAVTMIEQPEACDYGVKDWRGQRNQTVKNDAYVYRWHQSWAQGGPIIEREMLTVIYNERPEDIEGWRAIAYHTGDMEYGTTPLIAAMRCYVASKLGDAVDVPEELK